MQRNTLTRRLAMSMALCVYLACVVCPVAIAEQVVQQSTANQNLITGPALNPGDGKSGVTGLITTATVVATGGTTTTITTNTSQVAGQKLVWSSTTTTTALRGLPYNISSQSGSSAPYTLTMPTMAAAPVAGDVYTVYNYATGGSSTTVTSAQSATLGQWLTFPSTTATAGLQGVGAWVTGLSGSGPYTITVSPSLPATPTSSDFFGLSQVAWTIQKNGGGPVVPSGLISEPGNGYYTIAANATDDNTLGRTLVHWSPVTANSADPGETPFMIVAYNPLSQSAMITGVNGVAPPTTDGSGRVVLQPGEHTNIIADAQSALTAQGYTTTRAGYMDALNGLVAAIWAAGSRTLTAQSDSAGVTTLLGRLPQTLLFDGSGNIKGVVYAYNTGQDPATSVWGAGSRTLTAQSDTPGTTTLLGRVPQAILFDPSGNVKGIVYAYNTGLDPLTQMNTLLNTAAPGSPTAGSPYAQWGTAAAQSTSAATSSAANGTAIAALPSATAIANAVLAASIDGSITWKQAEALKLSVMNGKYTTSTAGGVTTTTYYRADGLTILAVSTLTTVNGTTTRTWTFSNLPS